MNAARRGIADWAADEARRSLRLLINVPYENQPAMRMDFAGSRIILPEVIGLLGSQVFAGRAQVGLDESIVGRRRSSWHLTDVEKVSLCQPFQNP